MSTISGASTSGRKFSPLLGVLASCLLVGALLGIVVYFDLHEQVLTFLEWVDEQGAWAAFIFVGVMVVVVVLILPGIFLTTGAGFIFGIVEGTAYVVVGTTLGAGLAFLIARYLLGERARAYITSHSKLNVMNDALAQHAFVMVLLTRLIPFFPGKISNYVFGLTRFPFWQYMAGSFIGFIPFSLHNVYLGSIAGDLTSLISGQSERSGAEWLVYGLGFLATVAVILYFNRIARKALARYTETEETS